MAIFPWYGALVQSRLYGAAEFISAEKYRNVIRWADMLMTRPAVQRGRRVNNTRDDIPDRIRYLAGNQPGTTTLLITAEQVGLLPHYMSLARLLQPALVVIEDVDLIARSREQMRSACDETMLNALLNEMDGLKENSDILFILTTNRPQDLEAALANRPGRIDQAIEVPLPDQGCREKLVRLYSRGLKLGDTLAAEAAKRTDGVSAAFIKELMRHTAQAAIARNAAEGTAKKVVEPTEADLGEALDDMLFSGGKLNVTLLGGAESNA
jgi:hypothetical protein